MSFKEQVKHGMAENSFKHQEIARNYNSMGNITEHGSELAKFVADHDCKGCRVMDFGCGTGLVGIPLLSECKEVIFLDPNGPMIQVLKDSLDSQSNKNYVIHEGTIFDYTGENPDVVVCSLVLHHVDHHEEVLKEIFNRIVPGGKIFIADFAPNPDRPAWTKEEFEGIVQRAGFINIHHQTWKTLRMKDPNNQIKEQPLQLIFATKPN